MGSDELRKCDILTCLIKRILLDRADLTGAAEAAWTPGRVAAAAVVVA